MGLVKQGVDLPNAQTFDIVNKMPDEIYNIKLVLLEVEDEVNKDGCDVTFVHQYLEITDEGEYQGEIGKNTFRFGDCYSDKSKRANTGLLKSFLKIIGLPNLVAADLDNKKTQQDISAAGYMMRAEKTTNSSSTGKDFSNWTFIKLLGCGNAVAPAEDEEAARRRRIMEEEEKQSQADTTPPPIGLTPEEEIDLNEEPF